MSEIAQAIANRQSENRPPPGRDQGVDRRRADPRCVSADGALHVAALFLADEGGCRGRQQVRGQAGEEAPGDVGRGEEGGIGAHDRLLGRTEEEGGQEVAPPAHWGPGWDGTPVIGLTGQRRLHRRAGPRGRRRSRQVPSIGLVTAGGTNNYPLPAVERQPALWREVEPDPLEVVVLRGTVTALGGLLKSSPGGGAERTPTGRGCVCPGRVETPTATPTSRGTDDQPVDLSIGSDTAPGGRRGPLAARPQLPFDGCGKTQGQEEEPLCDAS